MQLHEPLIQWPDPVFELVGFLASFLVVGAVGFRLWVVGRVLRAPGTPPAERDVLERAAARAAALGLTGALVSAGLFAGRLPAMAARQHLTVGELLGSNARTGVQATLVLAALVGLALAARRVRAGWWLAAVGAIVGPLSAMFFGQWNRLVVPLHRLAGGMWIGTLFLLVTAGLATVLRSELASERRGALVADLVNAFSPLALGSAAVLATFGVITAWQHLHTLSALWTTPYGIALLVKLSAVAVVVGLGAWNWRRQKPLLGTEAGAIGLRRTATGELIAAGIVLVLSAILVSLPSPRPPGEGSTGGPPAAGGAPPAHG